jgi:hypothetical protein
MIRRDNILKVFDLIVGVWRLLIPFVDNITSRVACCCCERPKRKLFASRHGTKIDKWRSFAHFLCVMLLYNTITE